MTTVHHSPPPGAIPFAIYEDPEDQEPPSPSEIYDEDMSFNSELSLPHPDGALPSIELADEFDEEPLPYRSSYTARKRKSQPRQSSGVTHYSWISAIPSESSISSKPMVPANEGTLRKERPRFRNPESVRAMQMSSPPPLPEYEAQRERTKGTYKLATPSRRSVTPGSKKSGSRAESYREHRSPMPTPTPQQAPLVLLHVTILPMQVPYSHDLMVRIMPEWLVENYKLLEEKLQDIILMRRGLLIPHPRDEYELLEERILESLELKTPRLLKCGHFVAPDDETDREDDDDTVSIADTSGRGSRMSGGTLTNEHKWEEQERDHSGTCTDCNREIKKPGKGVGAGSRKWDIKIYAANGLMRAAAWSACWNDMERCDVEISPWIPEELRKTLERRVQNEQEAEKGKQLYAVELQRQIQEAAMKQKAIEEDVVARKRQEEIATAKKREEDAELQKSFDAAAAALKRSVEEKTAEKKRFEDQLDEKLEEAKEAVRLELEAQAMAESHAIAERFRALEEAMKLQLRSSAPASTQAVAHDQTSKQVRAAEIPLSTLLKNYVLVLLGDQKNFIILVLVVLLVFFSMHMDPNFKLQQLSMQHDPRADALQSEVLSLEQAARLAITSTTTETSFATVTVTEILTAEISRQTPEPEAVVDAEKLSEEASPVANEVAQEEHSPEAEVPALKEVPQEVEVPAAIEQPDITSEPISEQVDEDIVEEASGDEIVVEIAEDQSVPDDIEEPVEDSPKTQIVLGLQDTTSPIAVEPEIQHETFCTIESDLLLQTPICPVETS